MSTSRQSRRPGKQQRATRRGHKDRRILVCCEFYCDICEQWWTELVTVHWLIRQIMLFCPRGHLGGVAPQWHGPYSRWRLEDRFRVVGHLRTTDNSWARNGYAFKAAGTLRAVQS